MCRNSAGESTHPVPMILILSRGSTNWCRPLHNATCGVLQAASRFTANALKAGGDRKRPGTGNTTTLAAAQLQPTGIATAAARLVLSDCRPHHAAPPQPLYALATPSFARALYVLSWCSALCARSLCIRGDFFISTTRERVAGALSLCSPAKLISRPPKGPCTTTMLLL